jgi:hypothetical protein
MTKDPTMARVTFTQDFDYKPTPRLLYAYKAGSTCTVKRECADAAIAAGKAFERKPPSRRKPAA